MPWHIQAAYPLTAPNTQVHAPVRQGVYGIRSGEKWVYFGQSDDLRRRLLEHLSDPSHCMHGYPNLEFVCEANPAPEDRLRQLLREFHPLCNSPFE
jgi:hypothetical protein